MRVHFKSWTTILLYVWIFIVPINLHSQPPEITAAFESISKITGGSGTDKTSLILGEAGFTVPESMRPHWSALSAYRKIETAYWAAEKGGKGNGGKFIALLTRKLAQEYESVPYEKSLKRFLAFPNERPVFASLATLSLPVDVPKDISGPILSITKYTDAKALGGTLGILRYYFDLSEDDAIKILRESTNDFDALIAGIKKASVPPSEKQRLIKIISDLRENYLTANFDSELTKITETPDLIKDKPGVALNTKPEMEKLKSEYKRFVDESHPDDASKKFNKMRINNKGFGGVIFGNNITKAENVGKLKHVVWIHEQDAKGINTTGRLEFVFEDGQIKRMPSVLWEDIYAAYNIIYVENKNSLFDKQEGIGLIGASYPNVYNEDKVYDSLIKSFGLSANEGAYYNFLSGFKKFRNAYDKNIQRLVRIRDSIDYSGNKLLQIKNDLKKKDSILVRLTDLIVRAKAEGRPYVAYQQEGLLVYKKSLELEQQYASILAKYKTLINKEENSFKQFTKDTVTYKSLQKAQLDFQQKDSMATVNVRRYLSLCKKAILHPILANLELGRSLYRADVLPRFGTILIDKIKSKRVDSTEIELCKTWLKGSDSIGWKFSDDSLKVNIANDFIQLTRKNNPQNIESQVGLLNFNAISTNDSGKTISEERPVFYNVLPVLTRTFYDYYRLNNYAKIMAIIRWAKQNGATFLNKPKVPPLCKSPAYSKLLESGEVVIVDREY